jgi:hypothetical protein
MWEKWGYRSIFDIFLRKINIPVICNSKKIKPSHFKEIHFLTHSNKKTINVFKGPQLMETGAMVHHGYPAAMASDTNSNPFPQLFHHSHWHFPICDLPNAAEYLPSYCYRQTNITALVVQFTIKPSRDSRIE